jgi:hypothetical protein
MAPEIYQINVTITHEAGQWTVEVDKQVVGTIRRRDGEFHGSSALDTRTTHAKVFVTALGPLISSKLNDFGHHGDPKHTVETERAIGAVAAGTD